MMGISMLSPRIIGMQNKMPSGLRFFTIFLGKDWAFNEKSWQPNSGTPKSAKGYSARLTASSDKLGALASPPDVALKPSFTHNQFDHCDIPFSYSASI
jgi:hypothetical protein